MSPNLSPDSRGLERVAYWILENPRVVMSHLEIADRLGTSKATVDRSCLVLEANNIITRLTGQRGRGYKSRYGIKDRARLIAVIEGRCFLKTTSKAQERKAQRKASSCTGTGTRAGRSFSYNLTRADFSSSGAILAAYERTIAQGLLEDAQAVKQWFFAVVARAKRGCQDICRFVASFVHKRRRGDRTAVEFVCNADYESGNAILRELESSGCEQETTGIDESRPSAITVVSNFASKAIAKAMELLNAAKPKPTPKPVAATANPDAALGRKAWCYLQDGLSLAKFAELEGVDLERTKAAVAAYAKAAGKEDRLKKLLG